jgi:uncharacterized protein
MRSVEWVIKASKFCNLRCAYCYEWNSLDHRERIGLDQWPQLLANIASYHAMLEARLGTTVESRLVWHGGEPLALPFDYLDAVMAMQHRDLSGLRHRILMQSNLTYFPEWLPDLLRRHDIGLGVSMDVIGGVRRGRRGQPTEAAVVANLDRLERLGISYGAITVVARHTLHRLRDVHDFWARRRVGFRVLPLFAGPSERPAELYEASDDELTATMADLFDHWLAAGTPVQVFPLAEWLGDVLVKLLGQKRPIYDRRRWGESVLIVETDGTLSLTGERGRPDLALGNVFRSDMATIMASSAYTQSLDRDDALSAAYCGRCHHHGFCNGYSVHAEPFERPPELGCPVTAAMHDHIERRLRAGGYDAQRLLSLLAPNMPAQAEP